jgi:beta-lactamase regulating signal transducer with metallopeptidase domain/tetratricopeptide (TPR) repeat protein
MLHLLWVGGVLGLIAVIGRRQLRSARPEVRYAVALACLGGLAISPIAVMACLVESSGQPIRSSSTFSVASSGKLAWQALDGLTPPRATASLPAPEPPPVNARPALSNIVAALPWLWLCGTPLTFTLLATGLIGAERLRRQSRVVNRGEIDQLCRRWADSLSIGCRVAVGICDRLLAPILVGIIRPLILLPPAALTGWSVEHLELVLLHELAHVRRRDNLVNLLQRVVESLLFFHPVVWWLSGWVRLERELCCDRVVVERTGRARAYAESLLSLSGPHQTGRIAALAMAENDLVVRIRRVLGMEDPAIDMKISRGILLMVTALFLVPALLIGTYAQEVDTKASLKTKPDPSHASVVQILQEAVQRADALKDARSKARMLMAIAVARANTGEQVSARAAFLQAVRAADAIRDQLNRVYTLEDIAGAQIDSNERVAALATMRHVSQVADLIGDKHQRSFARMFIVRTFARAGDVETALRFARELPEELDQKAHAFANVLEGLKADKPAIKRLLPSLLQAAEAVGDHTRQAVFFSDIAGVLADAGDVKTTPKIAETLEKAFEEFGPNDHSGQIILHSQVLVLSALARAQAKAGNRKAALETFQRAAVLAGARPDEGEGLRSARLGQVARNQADAGDIKGALRTADLVVYEYHKAIALVAIARAQAMKGQRDQARTVFHRAVQTARGIKPLDPVRHRPDNFDSNMSECLRTIAYSQAATGFSADAVFTAESIDVPKWKDSAFALIVMPMAKRGEANWAAQLVERIVDERGKAEALQGIAEGRAEAGDYEGALNWAKSLTTPDQQADAMLGIIRSIAKRPPADH